MYFQIMAAILDLPVTPTSESIYNSSTVLLDPENVGVAAGISLLSCIQAEIYDILCASESANRLKFVALCINLHLHYITLHMYFRQPSLI